ncbi:MAG: 16S rRNA (adenine(1518)-N(6)/adenine(1519)-N(6))-dimethyltransferase RsmA [Actinobacteria bacterium]|jgi:16S rRNA (adenine1518-N6/adenine1519-N6)-dimethyltransferase|nr:16S rRNA (adenine(1518)-N(6)/adenine(1519)-N(6))-dimethyltransferase RsmA [Actinomycetota bacterium]NDA94812.1 16S rRNA (adenine(1518)-N(6)/adenine(1519)-N(6))-dimethyltransferase RsmA [Actinomycetota bacterium]NDH80652.1 16S rRNA (adenine(1518)-N(6)/adenine(1519)-N(6))-dimethyltransferase RsmA [Actinomycetota bacterium]NDH98980.1 16S rRNA (adenine(1518)-N(6)/adenine(1519)-N(6))-dimethyltransferase RsmA [Actinomycetota bacterium]NDI07260.1 16S rRNA (adenine(1518)-N(6)/adenine(1519)-N(6))-dim
MTLLGAAQIRELAEELGIKPAKSLGQNFVIDANVCRKIVRIAGVTSSDVALEIGPGLGSLTLALLEEAQSVIAVEIDQRLAERLPQTVQENNQSSATFRVIHEDALNLQTLPESPTVLVANLPYNVSVPVLLHMLEKFPTLKSGVVMVQAEVADRLSAKPGSKEYGIPSVKAAWWADLQGAGSVSRSIFWPVPGVDSKLVAFTRHQPLGDEELRKKVFAIIDAAFAQRRKMLRSALSSIYGSSAAAEKILSDAGIDPTLRGESLLVNDFCTIARIGF